MGILGGIPSIGGNLDDQSTSALIETQQLGISDVVISDLNTDITITNNRNTNIDLQEVYIDGKPCG